jgi:hemin uptake protein HemP
MDDDMSPAAEAARLDAQPRPLMAAAAERVSSVALLRGGRKLFIEHGGETYTLQVTRQNKLLLTK